MWGKIMIPVSIVQEKRNIIANALELRLSYTNPLMCRLWFYWLEITAYMDLEKGC